MKADDLRTKFVDFFVGKDHKLLPPASLIPENDPSVLFTSAGMQQFKRYYTEPDQAPAKNIVTVQPCFRTSDIEAVGDDTHLTFFEMLGNFSFGGYLKKEAVEMAYEFLTDVLNIDRARIKCSIFKGDEINARDNQSAVILEKMGLKYEEYSRDDNFWGPTGNEGPCGPTVEFYVDDVEVWNLVFNEYFKNADGSYRKIDTPGVDTGMGLERMLVVKNGLKNVYETDLFEEIFDILEKELPLKKGKDDEYLRMIADHIKAAVMIANEGILPGKNEKESVLRKLIRRAVDYSQMKEFEPAWIKEVIEIIANQYQGINKEKVEKVIFDEAKSFSQILNKCEEIIKNRQEYSAKDAFNLFQSQGCPIRRYQDYAAMHDVKITDVDIEQEMRKHQEISRAGVSGFKSGLVGESKITTRMHTATHLLLKALQEVLGKEVHQRGSNINEERIRFDFSYPEAMTEEQIKKVEEIVNQKIKEDLPVVRKETTIEEAKKLGAEAQFLSKYGVYDKLTMYSIGDYSHELCGGPHVKTTSEIGKFKIIKEESSSAGVRRIRAVLE